MSFRGEIGDIAETFNDNGEISLDWKIPDFLALSCADGDYYQSRTFNACGRQWCIKMYPNGVMGIVSPRWVCVFLLRVDRDTSKFCNITLGIKGVEGVENKKEKELSEEDDVQVCCWIGFCLKSKLRELKWRLMPGNVLTLTLSMRSDTQGVAIAHTIPAPKIEEPSKDEENQPLEKQGGEKALEDFGKLLASGENSDVIILVDDVEFNVHSAILFARCPALSMSLQHDTKEKASKKITIEDCKPEIFRDFLQYLYTGSVQSLSENNVFGLYQISDKYLADDLRQLCSEHIGGILCAQTFCDTIRLALTHGESDLLRLATDYAAENIQSILVSAEWQSFNCECPQEANEILNNCFGSRS